MTDRQENQAREMLQLFQGHKKSPVAQSEMKSKCPESLSSALPPNATDASTTSPHHLHSSWLYKAKLLSFWPAVGTNTVVSTWWASKDDGPKKLVGKIKRKPVPLQLPSYEPVHGRENSPYLSFLLNPSHTKHHKAAQIIQPCWDTRYFSLVSQFQRNTKHT